MSLKEVHRTTVRQGDIYGSDKANRAHLPLEERVFEFQQRLGNFCARDLLQAPARAKTHTAEDIGPTR